MRPDQPDTPPGIEPRWNPGRGIWTFRVRYKDSTGARRSGEFDTCSDAEDFKAYLRLAKRSGVLDDLHRGRQTLYDFVQTAWAPHVAGRLARATQDAYQITFNRHIDPALGHLELRQITPPIVEQLSEQLTANGAQAPTIRKALAVLQSICAYAVRSGEMNTNPVRDVRKPKAKRTVIIKALSIAEVEALLVELRNRADEPAEWMLAEIMAYTGARPQDALALTYDRIGAQRLVYDHKNLNGEIVAGSKTGAEKSRSVEMLQHLRRDLLSYRALAAPNPHNLVLARADGQPWRRHDYRNWQRAALWYPPEANKPPKVKRHDSIFAAAAGAIGHKGATPYLLRHTFASLRLAEQRLSLQEIAHEMGHSVQVLSETYSHIISEYRGAGPVDPDAQITAARKGPAPRKRPRSSGATA